MLKCPIANHVCDIEDVNIVKCCFSCVRCILCDKDAISFL